MGPFGDVRAWAWGVCLTPFFLEVARVRRLLLPDRVFGGGVDTFSQFARRLISLGAALVLLLFSGVSAAATFYQSSSQTEAYTTCQRELTNNNNQYNTVSAACVLRGSANGGYPGYEVSWTNISSGSVTDEIFWWQGVPPSPSATACSAAPRAQRWVQRKILSQYFTDQTFTDPATGVVGVCKMVFNPATPPMQGKDGTWYTYVLLGPAADTVDPAPLPSGQVHDPAGNGPNPPVADMPTDASGDTNQTAPQMCGGGSCYDPNTGNYYAVSNGKQISVHGDAPTLPPNSCSGDGLAAICAGSPTPPIPNAQIGITDPATQIASTDKYTQADPTTGAVSTTTVNVYAGQGGSPTSGAPGGSISVGSGSKSSSPASSSSSGSGSSDSYGGGGDCNSPPVCQGDAVLCGETLQQWRTMCSAHTDAQKELTAWAGSDPTQQPPTFASDSTKYSQSDVWQQAGSSGSTTGDAANQGTYDQSGFGYSTQCPMMDLSVSIASASYVMPFSKICVIGPWIYWTVIGFSLYRAARITAGSAI